MQHVNEGKRKDKCRQKEEQNRLSTEKWECRQRHNRTHMRGQLTISDEMEEVKISFGPQN